MSGASRKRLRATALATHLGIHSALHSASPADIQRGTLSARVAQAIPTFWRRAASVAGVSGAEAFLLNLGRSVTSALHSVAESAEASRVVLQATRLALHAAIDTRCDELAARVNFVEEQKVSALERELVAVDAALESWRAESTAVREALSSLSDAELEAQFTTLSSRLDDMETQLHALPTAVMEPPVVGLSADAAALLPSIACFGRVFAPLPIMGVDLILEAISSSVQPGDTLRLRLSVGARHASQSVEELNTSLGRLAGTVAVVVTLESHGSEDQSLAMTAGHNSGQNYIYLLLDVPAVKEGSYVHVWSMSVAGQHVSGPPLRILAISGIVAPLLLKCGNCRLKSTSTLISPTGSLHSFAIFDSEVVRFCASGAPLPGLPVSAFGISKAISCMAYVQSSAPVLLLADNYQLVAANLDTLSARWSSVHREKTHLPQRIEIFPAEDLLVWGSYGESMFVHRLSDGSQVGTVMLPGLVVCSTHDPAARVLYGETPDNDSFTVGAWSYDVSRAGLMINSDCSVVTTETSAAGFRVAVMPPTPGRRLSHLVVVCFGKSSKLLVLSLPSHALIHTHTLEDMDVSGLAADPHGRAFAVCDKASDATHVLAWPLPGMPPLE